MIHATVKKLLRTRNVFLAALFLGLFAMAARNVTDPDVWWHLKTGQYISETGSVPHTDPFSYTRTGQPWVAHEWLSELLMYKLERTAGWGGLILIFAAVLTGAFSLLYLRCGSATYVAGVATLAAAWATVPLWGVRPQVLSLLFTSLWLLILDRSERNPKLLWWTLPLTLLWVNLHAGFAVGLTLSALYLAGEWIERVLGRSPQHPRGLRIAALIFLLDVLIVPLNPNGLRMFSYPFETLRSPAMQKYIAEWASPNFHHPEYWPFLLIVLTAFAALSWSRAELRPRDLLLLLVGLYAALVSIRLIPLFVLIAIPLVATRLGDWPRSDGQHLQSAARALLNGLTLLGMAAFAVVHTAQVIQRQPQVEIEHFPARAVAFLQNHPPSGRIFNHYDWGGYLIWKLYPSTPVFIDGRADLYGQELFDQFAETYQFKGRWQQTLQQWRIDTVIIPPDSPLATGLRISPDWTVSYEDSQAIVLTKLPNATRRQPASAKPSVAKPSPQNHSRLAVDAKAAEQLPSVCKKVHLLKHFAGYDEGV
jgi:hypothetical protein